MTDREFDAMATWAVEAIEHLGRDHAVAGACRGSGGPSAMAWLSRWLFAEDAEPFLDLGGGLGGPSAWLTDHHHVRPVLAEPAGGAVRGARRLFDLCAVQADGGVLPFSDGAFAAAWCLGVLSTALDVQELLAELGRVVRPGGRIGLVVYCSTGMHPICEPAGNHFPTRPELDRQLAAAGLRTDDSVALDDLADASADWDRLAAAVDREVDHRHGATAAWLSARGDEDQVAALLRDRRVAGHAFGLTTAPA